MVTKEKIKAEIDKLPEGLLDQVYLWLKKITSTTTKDLEKPAFTVRDFNGKLDDVDIRRDAYE